MIIVQKDQDVHSITEFIAFCKFTSLKNILLHSCKFKERGLHIFDIFQVLFFAVFNLLNFWRLSVSENSSIPFARDTAYRFLHSPYHHWRAFLSQIAQSAVSFCSPLTANDKRKIFVVDDSVYNKNRSKKLELLSRVFDHVDKIYVKGFRFLTLAFTDGISLIPIDFALLGTKKSFVNKILI